MYEGGIVGKKGGLRIEHLSRYNCSSNLEKLKDNKINEKEFNTTNHNSKPKSQYKITKLIPLILYDKLKMMLRNLHAEIETVRSKPA